MTIADYIKTPTSSPYAGAYLKAYKRAGDWCLYKHLDYNTSKILGYYLFCAQKNVLPDVFRYFKSNQAAITNYKIQVHQSGNNPVGEPLLAKYEYGWHVITLQKREGDVCYYVNRRSNGVIINHLVFKIKRNRLGNEVFPLWFHRNLKILSTTIKALEYYYLIVKEEFEKKQLVDYEMIQRKVVKKRKSLHRKHMAEIKKKNRLK